MKYAALISYDGAPFCGWQRQAEAGSPAAIATPSIQETMEKALLKITGEDRSVVGSGRTDAGVHAMGQVAHFRLEKKEWDLRILRKGLNYALRPHIQILELREVSESFHAQRSALKKQYSYYFQQGPCAVPSLEPYSWWIHKRLDLAAMQSALDSLVGEHDFKAFQSSGSKLGSTVRRILEAQITRQGVGFPGSPVFEEQGVHFLRMRLVGTGFLKYMVRGIAGTLLQIGEGRRPATDMAEILHSRDRSKLGSTATSRALWLEKVWYKDWP